MSDHSKQDQSRKFFPLHLFRKAVNQCTSSEACLILLNSNLYGMDHWLKSHWGKFSVKACADGGSNTLFDTMGGDKHRYIPDLICGDLDSATAGVLSYYRDKGSSIVQYTDQDSTDFTKTLSHLLLMRKQGLVKFSCVYVLNALWGRFDQTMGNIGTLFRVTNESLPVYLMSEDSILFLLKQGTNYIAVDSGLEESHCGLIPLSERCQSCSTTGLKWNLDGQSMEMTGLFSTSNIIDPTASQVMVSCTNSLVWTMSHTLNSCISSGDCS